MENILQRLLRWVKEGYAPPLIVDLNPTDYCNLKCRSCWLRGDEYKNFNPKDYELTGTQLEQIVREGNELGVEEWMITGGGEPLIRKDTFKIMELIKTLRMKGSITTNGTLFTDKMIKNLVDMGWDEVIFSIDSPDAKTNDWLRGQRGTFNKIVRSIELFNFYKQKLTREVITSQLPKCRFNTVLSNKNYKQLAEMIALAHRLGCWAVDFEPLTAHSKLGTELKLSPEELEELPVYLARAESAAKKYGIRTNVKSLMETQLIEKSNLMDSVLRMEPYSLELSSCVCFEPWYHLVIKSIGNAEPCCVFNDQTLNVKSFSLKEIWVHPHFNHIRHQILERNFPIWCKICNAGQVLQNRLLRQKLKKWMKLSEG